MYNSDKAELFFLLFGNMLKGSYVETGETVDKYPPDAHVSLSKAEQAADEAFNARQAQVMQEIDELTWDEEAKDSERL